MVVGAVAYSLFVAGLASASTEAEAAMWARHAAGLSYIVLFGFYWFAAVLGRADQAPWVRRIFGACGALAALDVLLRATGLVQTHLIEVAGQGWFPGPDRLYFDVYVPVMAVLVCTGLFMLGRRYHQSRSSFERRQLAYVFLAMGAATSISLLNFWPQTAFLAVFAPVLFTVILGYGITRNQLLDLRLLLRQGILGAMLSASLAFFLALTLLAMRGTWISHGGTPGALSLVVAAVMFTLAYEPLRRLSGRFLDRVFELENFDAGARLLAYANLASQYPRMEELGSILCRRLREDHGLDRVQWLLPNREGALSVQAAAPPEAEAVSPVALDSPLLTRLLQVEQGLDADELSWVRRYELNRSELADEAAEIALRELFKSSRCQLALALRSAKGRALGLLLLGAPINGRAFQPVERAFFAALASQLGAVLDHAQLQGQIRHADRLQSLGTLAAGLAHELRNPLASIMVFVQMLPERFADASFREKFNRVVQLELSKLERLTENLLQMARPASQALLPLELKGQIERVSHLLKYQFRQKQVTLETELSGEPWVRAAPDELGQVLINLLINALAVSAAGQAVRLTAFVREQRVIVQVLDQGSGIAGSQLERLFEPFFTTKADGSGLGLATSLRIVESFGGTLRVQNSNEGSGACFEVDLPLCERSAPPVGA